MMLNAAQAQGAMHLHSQHHGHHMAMEALNINPAALLYSPTGAMMRVQAGMLPPGMLHSNSAVMPQHSPPSSSGMPLMSPQQEHDDIKDHKHNLSFDDTDGSMSGDEGHSDGGEGPRKRGYQRPHSAFHHRTDDLIACAWSVVCRDDTQASGNG
jgi:hypothetical protein